MRGKQYLTRSEDYDRVYRQNASWPSRMLVLRTAPNNLEISRYGFSISKRVGTAVVRNRVRRRLREIVRRVPVKPGWDIVLIARPAAAVARYDELEGTVASLLLRAKLLDKRDEIFSLKAD